MVYGRAELCQAEVLQRAFGVWSQDLPLPRGCDLPLEPPFASEVAGFWPGGPFPAFTLARACEMALRALVEELAPEDSWCQAWFSAHGPDVQVGSEVSPGGASVAHLSAASIVCHMLLVSCQEGQEGVAEKLV